MGAIEFFNLNKRRGEIETWLMSHENHPDEKLIRDEYKIILEKLHLKQPESCH